MTSITTRTGLGSAVGKSVRSGDREVVGSVLCCDIPVVKSGTSYSSLGAVLRGRARTGRHGVSIT